MEHRRREHGAYQITLDTPGRILSRRAFLKMLASAASALWFLRPSRVFASSLTGTATLTDLVGNENVVAVSRALVTWRITYTAGSVPVQPGGRVRVIYYGFHEIHEGPFQTNDPTKHGYASATRTGDGSIHLVYGGETFDLVVNEASLSPGDQAVLTIGDIAQGGPGWYAPCNSGGPVNPVRPNWGLWPRTFKVFVDLDGTGTFTPLGQPNLHFTITHATAASLHVALPSDAMTGAARRALLRLTDLHGNVVEDFAGDVQLSSSDPLAALPPTVTLTPADKGRLWVDGVSFGTTGVQTITASVSGGPLLGRSNPTVVAEQAPERLTLWGELHCHTQYSDGRDTPDDCYRYARDTTGLQFCAVSDHSFGADLSALQQTVLPAKADEYNAAGTFATLLGFEWTGEAPLGGDHNVYYRDSNGPILPHYGGTTSTLSKLFQALESYDAIVIPHHVAWSGWGAVGKWKDWSQHHPRLERLVEIYSVHGACEFQGNPRAPVPQQIQGRNVQDALALGYKLGITCGADTHVTRPGIATACDINLYRPGLVAVQATAHTREAIWQALYDRRCYGTTGERIVLDFRINGEPMGSELPSATGQDPSIWARVIAPASITSVDVVKGTIGAATPFPVVYSLHPSALQCEFTWSDPATPSDCFYYLRVTLQNGEMAWSSPIWVSPSLKITSIVRDPGTGHILVTWGALPYRFYEVSYRDDTKRPWSVAQTMIPSGQGYAITWTDDGQYTSPPPWATSAEQRFYRVRVVT